jgi:fructose-1,6-bisphosphatase/inositol monophosphatase family enzyme
VAFVVHVELVVDGVILEISDEARDIDDGQEVDFLVAGQVRRDRDRPVEAGSSLPRCRRGGYRRPPVDDDDLVTLLDEVASAVRGALGALDDWGLAGTRPGQYRSDLAADAAALGVLDRAGVGVLSEESGRHRPDAPLTVVVDPVDGSTNASRGVPWYATSLCAVDHDGPRVALVVDLASGHRFSAVRGRGATRDGEPIRPSSATSLGASIVGLSGYPPRHLGWRQFRALGAAALDLCAVASGVLDGMIDCHPDAHGPWDYLGGLLVCREAGAPVVDALGRDLVVLDHGDRRTPVAAATPQLLDELLVARAW